MKLFCWHKWHYYKGYVSMNNGDFAGIAITMKVCKKCGKTKLHEVRFSY